MSKQVKWHWESHETPERVVRWTLRGPDVDGVICQYYGRDLPDIANTLAAAPDMLEALQAILNSHESCLDDDQEVLDKINAAIAKAQA